MQDALKPALIFTWGNPSRGDDAIGPIMYDLLRQEAPDEIELLTDFQLQIEHITDLENRERILFIDASISSTEPFEFYRLKAVADHTYTTHAMSPASLLAVYTKVNHHEPPPAFMLSIRGYEFDLGKAVSARAQNNLSSAREFLRQLIYSKTEMWDNLIPDSGRQ
jgi:hydrogenase maturation protease